MESIGGIVGDSLELENRIANCVNNGVNIAQQKVTGIVGNSNGFVSNYYNTGLVHSCSTKAGGIIASYD